MSVARALEAARRLQAEADAGWLAGYDAARVRAEASRCLEVLAAAATTPARARELVVQLNEVEAVW
jgi:hypothetical protein